MLLAEGYTAGIYDTIWPFIFCAIITLLFVIFRKQIKSTPLRKAIPILLLGLIIVFELSFFSNIITIFNKPFQETMQGLPLHLCSTSAVLVMLYLSFKKKWMLEILFYQGMIGAVVTFIFPSTSSYPGSFDYIRFFLSHTILYLTPIYFYIVEGYRPTKRTLKIGLIAIHIIAAVAVTFNLLFDSEYMYLLPDNSRNLFHFIPLHDAIPFMGNWPMVIIFGELLVFPVFFGVHYLFKYINKHYKPIED